MLDELRFKKVIVQINAFYEDLNEQKFKVFRIQDNYMQLPPS